VSKTFVVENDTWACVELFLVKPDDFKPLFYRSLDAIDNGVKNFVGKMRGEAEQ
jgi:hypothetical protein